MLSVLPFRLYIACNGSRYVEQQHKKRKKKEDCNAATRNSMDSDLSAFRVKVQSLFARYSFTGVDCDFGEPLSLSYSFNSFVCNLHVDCFK